MPKDKLQLVIESCSEMTRQVLSKVQVRLLHCEKYASKDSLLKNSHEAVLRKEWWTVPLAGTEIRQVFTLKRSASYPSSVAPGGKLSAVLTVR
eukprot:767051-Hanusia_phi.AAC.2